MARRPKAGASAPAAETPTPLALPAELTIYTVGSLHPLWRAWVDRLAPAADGDPSADVDAAAVDQVDAAGLQLLLSLAHSLTARGRRCRLRQVGAVLQDSCAALGLAEWLDRHRETAGAAA